MRFAIESGHLVLPTNRVALVILMLSLLALVPIVKAGNSLPIRFTSIPNAAVVCKKVGKNEACHGKTPLTLKLEFKDLNESRRYVLHKIGYHSATVLVTADSDEVTIKLDKQPLFLNPKLHKIDKLQKLQRSVNSRVAKIIYSYQGSPDQNFRPTGKFAVIKTSNNKIRFKFSVLINNSTILKSLKKAGRTRNEAKRYSNVIKILRQHSVFDYFDTIARSVNPESFDAIEFNVLYSKSQAVLDFDQVEEINQRWTGSYYTSYGDVVQEVNTYEVYSTSRDVTVVKDRIHSVDYTFLSENNTLPKVINSGLFAQLSNITIFTNDTRKNTYKRINPDSNQ